MQEFARSKVHWLLVMLCAVLGSTDWTHASTAHRETSQGTVSVAYEGSRFSKEEIADGLARVERVMSAARRKAELSLGRAADTGRLRVRVVDIPEQDPNHTYFMLTYGGDFCTVDIHAEPLLSGVYPDSAALASVLAHEFVHVIARQGTTPELYSQLPDWFQEGLPILLIGQTESKLGTTLVNLWDRPMDLLEAFEEPVSPLAGSFILQDTRQRLGRERFLEFVDTALQQGRVAPAFEKVDLSEEAIITSAKSSMQSSLSEYMKLQGNRFAECMTLYQQGREQRLAAIRCFMMLIEELPGTECASASHYWLAKCYYHVEQFAEARVLFEQFLSQGDYGLRDDAQYYEIRMLTHEKRVHEAREACETYFRFYPYGNQLSKVTTIYTKLPAGNDLGP